MGWIEYSKDGGGWVNYVNDEILLSNPYGCTPVVSWVDDLTYQTLAFRNSPTNPVSDEILSRVTFYKGVRKAPAYSYCNDQLENLQYLGTIPLSVPKDATPLTVITFVTDGVPPCIQTRTSDSFCSLITSNAYDSPEFQSEKKGFDFSVSEIDLKYNIGINGFLEYLRFTCPTGFTSGSITAFKILTNLLGQTFPVMIGSVGVQDKQTYVNLNLGKNVANSGGFMSTFTGQIKLQLNFGAVPDDCADDIPTPPEDQTFIEELPVPLPENYPPLPEYPVEPLEPLPPYEPVEPEVPTVPTVPTPPAPELNCECFAYVAESIQDLTRVLALEMGKLRVDLVKTINLLGSEVDELSQSQRLMQQWFSTILFEQFQRLVSAQYQTLEGTEKSFSEILQEINQNAKDFVTEYEPVNIENEYRTVSHRIIDDLDSTLNKL